jgi:hypothetical protein
MANDSGSAALRDMSPLSDVPDTEIHTQAARAVSSNTRQKGSPPHLYLPHNTV